MQLKDVVFVVSNKQIYCDVAGVKTRSTVPKSVRRNTGRKGIERCAYQLALRVTESSTYIFVKIYYLLIILLHVLLYPFVKDENQETRCNFCGQPSQKRVELYML